MWSIKAKTPEAAIAAMCLNAGLPEKPFSEGESYLLKSLIATSPTERIWDIEFQWEMIPKYSTVPVFCGKHLRELIIETLDEPAQKCKLHAFFAGLTGEFVLVHREEFAHCLAERLMSETKSEEGGA